MTSSPDEQLPPVISFITGANGGRYRAAPTIALTNYLWRRSHQLRHTLLISGRLISEQLADEGTPVPPSTVYRYLKEKCPECGGDPTPSAPANPDELKRGADQ